MSLWAERDYYEDMMSPDEEAAWAEHDRRCGHTPSNALGVLVFGAGKDGTPLVNEDTGEGPFSPRVRSHLSPMPASERVSLSAAGLLLVPPSSSGPAADPSKEVA